MLYIPRRHRRKLLLPPGLLALAFLLLVGCGVIAPIVKERTKAVLQATFPNSHSTANIYSPTTKQLEDRRSWVDFKITGNKLFDWYSWQQAQQRIKASVNNSDTLKGTRIYFHKGASYRYMITTLSYMNTVSVERFTFDLRPTMSILYILDGKRPARKATRPIPFFSCGTGALMEAQTKKKQIESLRQSRREAIIKNFTDFTNSREGIGLILFYSLAIIISLLSVRHIFYNLFSSSSVE